ncbi:MAG: pantetheine-phosphate adenylyltransferase [Myxococcales bacterium]|nr:pantetheine-phosphate adenylyltransferase [Polyangiaceae bacterium]MDW8249472.1 pantetheine-phosphate adenylyltransferase [Myxococcales bacterium]
MITAIYAGSFDPPTRGHLDLIRRASPLVGRLLVAIGSHPTRRSLFSVDERLALLHQLLAPLPNVEVQTFQGLLVEHCRAVGATVILRGLRSGADLDYELPMAQANQVMAPEIETLFLLPRPEHSFVSASLAREIASHGGDVSRFVEPLVADALQRKLVQGKSGG